MVLKPWRHGFVRSQPWIASASILKFASHGFKTKGHGLKTMIFLTDRCFQEISGAMVFPFQRKPWLLRRVKKPWFSFSIATSRSMMVMVLLSIWHLVVHALRVTFSFGFQSSKPWSSNILQNHAFYSEKVWFFPIYKIMFCFQSTKSCFFTNLQNHVFYQSTKPCSVSNIQNQFYFTYLQSHVLQTLEPCSCYQSTKTCFFINLQTCFYQCAKSWVFVTLQDHLLLSTYKINGYLQIYKVMILTRTISIAIH